ncbi:helix-turn-helix domain-containing protein [Streptomyces sp. NBC_01214]|uniref:helix-turn-helix domain-containing protein n=1 Tax=Streptomyces sp. NBC_01214 TaxID=2903777 RepID=UPI00224E6377|nr:helix-turn-helix transcriptional regulator [Streptomyces sp. NBC_01214]MCX4802282.1 helix-turn-helix domain-containing protein [Streptomyces sp. NBC_01214]
MSEAEDFARLMRELKERAGLSYGTLARRLHTSTSTLHRYCKGEALPAEFAVVDRFARACGATREEALDLHRAWLLADARRRAGAAEVPVPASVPVPEAESEPKSEPTVVVTPDPEPEPVARGARYRRRAAVVVAVGVTAGAVAVALLAAAGPGPGAPHAGGSAGTGSGAGTSAGTSAPPFAGSGSASAPASTGAPEPTPPTGATGSAGATAAAPVRPSASPPASAPGRDPVAPLKAAVRSHVWTAGCDHAYLSERGPGSVPPPPVEADAPAWASAQRAVHAGTQIVEVTLHGTGEGAVVLEDLEVRVAARRKPPAWNVYQMSQGCGGGLTPAAFAVNLDAPRPLARPVAGNDGGNTLPAPSFPLRVSAAEPAVLRVVAATTGCDCDWSLDLRWTGPSGSGTLRIDEGGRPLRTSAAPGRPVYGYALEQGRWAR